jgi:hypothetical protein
VLKRVRERLEQMHADLAATPGPEE